MKKVLFLLMGMFLLVGCNQKQKDAPTDEQNLEEVVADSSTVGPAYDSLVVCESRAMLDSVYRNSDEYKKSHDKFALLSAKLTEGKSEVDANLCLLGYQIASFLHYSEYFAKNTAEMSDVVNQKRMQLYGQKVRELRQQLIQSKLSDEQQAQLDSLNGLIQF